MKKAKADSAILIVLIAGIFWSFGALVVRFIEDAQSVPWQYLFFRGVLLPGAPGLSSFNENLLAFQYNQKLKK